MDEKRIKLVGFVKKLNTNKPIKGEHIQAQSIAKAEKHITAIQPDAIPIIFSSSV